MEVYFIRHGQTEPNKQDLHCGWGDVPLTSLGQEQAKMSGRLISDIQFDKVFVSDLLRAKQTAEIALPGYEYHFSDKIREIHVGDLSFQSTAACLEKYGQMYMKLRSERDFRFFGGESAEQMMERVSSFMRELENVQNANNVAIVAHAGTAYCIMCYIFGYHIPRHVIELNNAALARFTYQEGVWKLNTWNGKGTF